MKYFHNLHLSAIALLMTNFFILFLALNFNWSVYDVLVLFWAETAIVAFYFVLRVPFLHNWASIFIIPFLIIHMCIFMFIHLVLIKGVASIIHPTLLKDYTVFIEFLSVYWIALIPIFVSHGVSYIFNFIKNKEYKKIQNKIKASNYHPYKRILIMHTILIIGALLTSMVDTSFIAIFILVTLKSIFDLNAHILEHSPHL